MPVKNGLDTLRGIKKLYKDIKVVMLTVENDKNTTIYSIRNNIDSFFNDKFR